MAVTVGSPEAGLTHAVGGDGPSTPLATPTEGLTFGWWDGLDLNTFPPPAGGGEGVGSQTPIELLYPIEPESASNRLAFKSDDSSWKVVQKSENKWQHEFITLKYRIVNAPYMNTVMQFLEDNAANVINLSTPGVQPFFNSSEMNQVWIKSVSKPIRETPITYILNITFLYDPNQ